MREQHQAVPARTFRTHKKLDAVTHPSVIPALLLGSEEAPEPSGPPRLAYTVRNKRDPVSKGED